MGLDCERVDETAVCEVHCGFSSVDLSEWRVRARFRCVGRGAGCAHSCLSSRLHIRQPDVEQASDLYIQIRLVSAILAEKGVPQSICGSLRWRRRGVACGAP